MNITHAKKETTNKESLKAIFERQRELMEKYHDIELKSGLLQTEDCPVNLDDKRGQARIKDFSWRITEEIGEALDALENEEGEAAYVVPSYKKESSLDKEVKMKYMVGNAAKLASIDQTITTGAKENSSYIAENREAKTKVVIGENVDKRTQTVEQLMGEL